MLLMERIPGQTGYLVLTMDGAVIESGGDLSNDERTAEIITSLVNTANRIDFSDQQMSDYRKMTLSYEDHSYTICLSNKKLHVVKTSRSAMAPPSNEINGGNDPALVNV
ncbi:ragulator complex protein LAMTOR4 homolog [Chrysoperla carnea]|uniref:ragulator complex protein LAMTOR4 homolog n=1 Tax=Chrysoperla carnea TaxID=189513 RepID=UPI001D07DFE1|nr:ragulator complex protein LAMTOR4 homolog [Chrysoperla carnea]